MPDEHTPVPFVLIAFPEAAGPGRALRFDPPLDVRLAVRADEVGPMLAQADRWAAAGLHVAGWVGYEAAPAFDPAMRVRPPLPDDPPLAWMAAARVVEEVPLVPSSAARVTSWTPDESRAAHRAAVGGIRDRIARGDVYQVNHTTRLRATVDEDPIALLARLAAGQRGTYAALFDIGAHRVISVSPELFFERNGERIVTRPMKGTAPRGRWPAEDERLAATLAASEKERAENVMIVDLLRNDLGRLARPGTVRVTSLFDVERYDTVWQLTSTIEASVPAGTTLGQCFAALFPCGSVTGAPKIAAMAVIAELEPTPRGPYCGAIGYVAPGGRATFSVGIRTLVQHTSSRQAVYGAGGGITWDSDPEAEYDELLAKSRILTHAPAIFALLETMRLEDGIVVRAERHLARLEASARYFGFTSPTCASDALARLARKFPSGTFRVRLLCDRDGGIELEHRAFTRDDPGIPIAVAVATAPVDRTNPLLFHKTTARGIYDALRRDARETLLWNERREATEFTIGNLVAELAGELLTPPIDCGLLPGVFRQELLDAGTIREAVLPLDALARASRVWMVNSLREWVPVRLPSLPDR